MKIKYWHIIPLLIFVLSAYYLISGSDLLVKPLSYDPYIPLGTVITWFGLISMELLLYILTINTIQKKGWFSMLIRTSVLMLLILSIAWAPTAFALSGNFAFNFIDSPNILGITASKIFWSFSYFLGGAAIFFFLIIASILIFKPIHNSN